LTAGSGRGAKRFADPEADDKRMGRNVSVSAILMRGLAAVLVAVGTQPAPMAALGAPVVPEAPEVFSTEQVDALLAPIALYPDPLLAQVLMASTYPLQIVQAQRWLDEPVHQPLSGDALEGALRTENWDPSVKSLVPFPQVLSMMSTQLDWTQQLGYAVSTQEKDVMDSVQRLRRQAQIAGALTSTAQQTVTNDGPTVIIQPAEQTVVYVPVYNPSVVYGAWPYSTYPPVYFPPPPGYVVGAALAFGAGVAIARGLWNVGYPNWRYGSVNINVNRWNTVNINRPPVNSPAWRPPATQLPARTAGPVGRPGKPSGLPATAVGRPNVQVPSSAVNRPAQRPAQLPARPSTPTTPSAPVQRPAQLPTRPSAPATPIERPAQLPARANAPTARPAPSVSPLQSQTRGNALSNISEGSRAGQYGARGNQSIQSSQSARAPVAGNARIRR
jgi:hypothetical protein